MILVFDTSGNNLDIGLFDEEAAALGEFHHTDAAHERGVHDRLLAEQTKRLFTENNISVRNLTRIGFINGPGSFTGLRIGLAFAKGLAFASDIKLVPLIMHVVLKEIYSSAVHTENVDAIVTEGYESKSVYYAPLGKPENVTLKTIAECATENLHSVICPPKLRETLAGYNIASVPVAANLSMIAKLTRSGTPIESIASLEPFYGTDFLPTIRS